MAESDRARARRLARERAERIAREQAESEAERQHEIERGHAAAFRAAEENERARLRDLFERQARKERDEQRRKDENKNKRGRRGK